MKHTNTRGKPRLSLAVRSAQILIALAIVLVAAAADKQPVLPKDLPAYGTTKPLAAPRVAEIKLDNGMTVWLVPQSGYPKVSFAVAVRGGYTADPKDRPGFAELMAAVVTQGTSNRSSKQVAEDLAASGGDLSADSTPDSIVLQVGVLSNKAEVALNVLSDVMQHATFSDQEVAIAKNNLASSLKANEADPSFLGRRALYHALFGQHPYAVTAPTQDSLAKTTPADLRAQYAARFRPDRTLLIAVGDFAEPALTSAIRTSFGNWKTAATAAPIETAKPAPAVSKTIDYVPRAGSVQTTLYLGTLGPTRSAEDYAAARVGMALYGGMFGSRLVNNIREDKGYTYSPGARITLNREAGVVATRADVRNEVTGASFNEITYELNRMATTAPEQEEVDHAKRYLLGSLALSIQSQAGLARQLASLWIDSLPPQELAQQAQKIEKVTPQEVEAAGRKYFPAWRMTVVAVGEEKVIKNELAPFGMEFQQVQ
jgi:predicted Zn-dependent peptidase